MSACREDAVHMVWLQLEGDLSIGLWLSTKDLAPHDFRTTMPLGWGRTWSDSVLAWSRISSDDRALSEMQRETTTRGE